jgi:hypothetical protein
MKVSEEEHGSSAIAALQQRYFGGSLKRATLNRLARRKAC